MIKDWVSFWYGWTFSAIICIVANGIIYGVFT